MDNQKNSIKSIPTEIFLNRSRSKFDRIWRSPSWSKFGCMWSNFTELSLTKILAYSTKSATTESQPSRPYAEIQPSWPDQNSIKFDNVRVLRRQV